MKGPDKPSAASSLTRLFDAEREVRKVSAELLRGKPKELVTALRAAVVDAKKQREEEASLRLVRVSSLLGELEGPDAVDLLIDVLDADAGEARWAAGEELRDLAFDRFKEVALGLERALKRLPPDAIALTELPFVVAEIPEPGVAKLLGMFLAHPNAEVVAAGLEAAVMLGDPRMADTFKTLLDDKRLVHVEDEEGEGDDVTIGVLAADAISMLEGGGDEGDA